MLAILSPAKTLDFSDTPDCSQKVTQPLFIRESSKLNNALQALEPPALSSLMKISDNLAELNHRRNLEWKSNTKNHTDSKAAVLAFKGDVYQGLDASSLDKRELDWMQNNLRILSGLYGILRPLDEICAYRLEMGTNLSNAKGKNLYDFWGDRVTDALNRVLIEANHKALVNLASNEYFKVIQPSKLAADLLTVNFKEKKNGDYKFISFHAKKARGLMTRFMVKNRIKKLNDLKDFDYEDYQFNEQLSDTENWIFTRG